MDVNAGFNDMATVHIIDQVVFDFSFDSLAIANQHEAEMRIWLTEQLLPIVDSILTTHDDTETVLRFDNIVLDLGDIPSDDCYAGIIQKVSEQLTKQLRQNHENHRSEHSASVNGNDAPLAFQQVKSAQIMLERLKNFLLTGQMAWHVDTRENAAHEQILADSIRQDSHALARLLKQSSPATRNTLIRRLVKQFSQQSLEQLLTRLAPNSKALVLDLIIVMQAVIGRESNNVTQPEETHHWLWMLILETLSSDAQGSDNASNVIKEIFARIMLLQARIPELETDKVIQTAIDLTIVNKISPALSRVLLKITGRSDDRLVLEDAGRDSRATPTSDVPVPEQSVHDNSSSPGISDRNNLQPHTVNTILEKRVLSALIKADISGVDAKRLQVGSADEIRQYLLTVGESTETLTQLVTKLPERVLLDLVFLYSPQAAALIEQLLAQSNLLFEVSAATRSDAVTASDEEAWQQQLWLAGLAYLMNKQNTRFDPVGFIQALTQHFAPTPDTIEIIQGWHQALEQTKHYGVLQNTLQGILQGRAVDFELFASQSKQTVDNKTEQHSSMTAVHQRVMQALVKANISAGVDAKRLQTGSADEISQYLLKIGESTETLVQLVVKLPERILLDLAFLMSPQAAALIEQLLVQSSLLSDAIAENSSATDTEMTWQQQLWLASLSYLMSQQKRSFDPADFIQALAQHFAPTRDVTEVIQRWHQALAQTQRHGTLQKLLQTLLTRQDQPQPQPQPQPVAEEQTVIHGSPSYQQLYRRLIEPTDMLEKCDLLALIKTLETEHPEELRQIFVMLHHNPQLISIANLKRTELQPLINALIALEIPGIERDQQDMIQAINHQAVHAKDQTVYYQCVLHAMLQGDVVDLEAYASQSKRTAVEETTRSSLLTATHQRVMQALVKANVASVDAKRLQTGSADEIRQYLLTVGESTEILSQLVAKLPERILLDLAFLMSPQAAALIEQLLAQSDVLSVAIAASNSALNVETAWQQQLWLASLVVLINQQKRPFDPADFIQALAQHFAPTSEATEIIQSWHQALEQTQRHGTLQKLLQTLLTRQNRPQPVAEEQSFIHGNPSYQQLYRRLIDPTETLEKCDLSALIKTLETEQPNELRQIFATLRHNPQLISTANLKRTELQPLINTLIALEIPGVEREQRDMIQAIDQQAVLAEDQTVYYQRVLLAMLQEEAVDLEAFASQSKRMADNKSTEYSSVTATYQRVMQALVKANISGLDAKRLQTGSAETIHQHLLTIGESTEILAQLVAKLPERLLLDLVFLMSPQAAALIEQLLAQSNLLFEASAATISDAATARDEEAWQQQLWLVSLTVLMKPHEKPFDPAGFIKALAQHFAPTSEAIEVIQSWYQALLLTQQHGTLQILLQTLLTQQDKLQLVIDEQTAIYDSPGYQQLYRRLIDPTDTLEKSDLSVLIKTLESEYPDELHNIFDTLRHRSHLLSAAKLPAAALQSLIAAFIELDKKGSENNHYPMHQAINEQALHAHNQAVYYQSVLSALLQDEVVDLELFAANNATQLSSIREPVSSADEKPDFAQENAVPTSKPLSIIRDDELGLAPVSDVTEEIYIHNAGQVLAAPYLPRLFDMLGLVEEGAFIDRRAAERAVHLLQFMVNEQTQSPEYQLPLNKILCGITTGVPICKGIEISDQERETVEQLIQGMIQNWKTIGNTSMSGLRETFLQRDGVLHLKEGMWFLTIEPGTFDMLLDGLPWSFSVIKHVWMDRAIQVTWR